ncbi:hypothetical protein Leryth_002927 [Lithospermum erythrorhizon]|nr:hypothetical protein Leryth_002927 [Lithospermum erythrorhizon]
MYNNSVLLDDQQVTFFWTLSKDSISIAARGEKKSGYLAIGFGREMLNSYAYVGWFDEDGKGRVNTYWIDGRDASGLHPTNENLTYVSVSCQGLLLPGGILSARYLKHVKDDKWFQLHVYLQYSGLAIIFLGFLFAVAELQGVEWKHLGDKYVIYLEYHERKRRHERIFGNSNWVLGDGEDEDIDLLSPSGIASQMESHSSEKMEVQLEPMSR